MFTLPYLRTNSPVIDAAFRIAIGDLVGNIQPFQDGLLDEPRRCILAGLEYNTPWTRDTAINVWNGAGLIFPAEAKNTLLSVLQLKDGQVSIGGQYWDAIIWATGAWAYYRYTGDRDFLALAFPAVQNSLDHFEKAEFNPVTGLFRGPACYGDGVAAYPDRYAQTGGSSSILEWPKCKPSQAAPTGYGIPMQALSTNCLYYNAYRCLDEMAGALGQAPNPAWSAKAAQLKDAIQRHFWEEKTGCYRYLVDEWGGSDAQEGLGSSFALLFGLADPSQVQQVLTNQFITPNGIPCVWPNFERYQLTPDSYGRHSGTVWPHVQGFWAEAAARAGAADTFGFELFKLAQLAVRDGMFAEIYHPISGAVYGGVQEGTPDWQWHSCRRQTWSATAYLRMALMGLAGMDFSPQGIHFHPMLLPEINRLELRDLPYRQRLVNIQIRGAGQRIMEFRRNGQLSEPFLPAEGEQNELIEIIVE